MIDKLSLYTTSRCNLNCTECIMQFLRKNDPQYDITIEELKTFIDVTERSGYHFFFTLSGGEPLLWPFLCDGIQLLKQSPICDGIEIYTNAIYVEPLLYHPSVVSLITQIRISEYFYNRENIKKLKNLYPTKVRTVPRTKFWPNPTMAIPGTIPPTCLYDKVWYYRNRIYPCAHCVSLSYITSTTTTIPSKTLEVGYLDGITDAKFALADLVCNVCVSNQKVRDQIDKQSNIREFL